MKNEGEVLVAAASEEQGKCIEYRSEHHGADADQGRPCRSIHPGSDIGKDQEADYSYPSKPRAEHEKDENYCVNEWFGHTFSPPSDRAMAIVPA